ncbi:hypothetical protein NHQ30_003136 [Ciborinia camelliae]|nr:hypothetical protein NHQ30_003136 [Ciborinia camelliae]
MGVANTADHSRMRRTLAHAFSDVTLREQESLMTKYFEQLIANLREKIDGPAAGYVDLDVVIEEALRMYPPTPSTLPRRTRPEGEVINGAFIPGHTSVGVNHWAAYHASKNFTDPNTFDPDRWSTSPPDKYKDDAKAAFQPFSMGPRSCLGKK